MLSHTTSHRAPMTPEDVMKALGVRIGEGGGGHLRDCNTDATNSLTGRTLDEDNIEAREREPGA